METEQSNHIFWSAAVIAAGILLSGIAMSVGFANLRKPERVVTVRGLSEREVDADLAVWPVTFSIGGDSLEQLQKDILFRSDIVVRYLEDYDIPPADITVKEPSVTDNTTNPYINKTENTVPYVARTTVMVRSQNIEAVRRAVGDSIELIGQGIPVQRDYDSQPQYFFTGLNDIKPEMIAEATKNARAAAEQFARDSGSRVGKIRTATQGLFSIEDAAPGLSEKKSVRVVTSVEYILID